MTYVYAESTAVVGPLALQHEPHSYDLCAAHAGRLTVPRGWQVVRYEGELTAPPTPDELTALAEAVREAGRAVQAEPTPAAGAAGAGAAGSTGGTAGPTGTGRHLRVLPGKLSGKEE